MKKKLLLFGAVAVTAVAVACGEKAATPVSPSPAVSSETAAAAADGSTLKATAPALQQPANGSTGASLTPNLVIANSTLMYLGDVSLVGTLQYRFVVETTGGASVHNVLTGTGAGLTGSKVPAGALQPDTTYRWRARAEIGSSVGPWSAYWTFTTAKSGGGLPSYQNATELWDNLTDGRTIGSLVGGAQLVPGKGVLLPAFESHVTYTLQSTLTSGSIECLIENLSSDTNGGKTKVFSSQQGTPTSRTTRSVSPSRSAAMTTRTRASTGCASSPGTRPAGSTIPIGFSRVRCWRRRCTTTGCRGQTTS